MNKKTFSLDDWAAYQFNFDWIFGKEKDGKHYFMLIHPDGSYEFYNKHVQNIIVPNNVVYCSYSMWFDLNEFEIEILSLGNKISFIDTQELAKCRKLKIINYTGTMKEFYSISTNCDWHKTPVEEINCKDGKIKLKIN